MWLQVIQLLQWLYWYCVDFLVNLGNLVGLTYLDVNVILFIACYPLFTMLLTMLVVYQEYLLRSVKK